MTNDCEDDGGVVSNLPLSSAIVAGATRITAVIRDSRPSPRLAPVRGAVGRSGRLPDVGAIE